MTNANDGNAAPSLTRWIVQNRGMITHTLFDVAVVLVGLAIWFGTSAFSSDGGPTKKDAKDKDSTELFAPKDKEKEKDGKGGLSAQTREDYLALTLWAGLAGVTMLTLGWWWVTREHGGSRDPIAARKLVLIAGGVFGLLTALLGLRFTHLWRESLLKWINDGEVKEAKWILIGLTIYVGGLVLMFFSLQPARADERSSPGLRKLIYGFNSVLMGLLLLLVLASVNVWAGMKLPTILDTTESRLYSLEPRSKQFLKEMDKPVNAYLILSATDPLYQDVRSLLVNANELNSNFKPVFLSPSIDRDQVLQLMERLKIPRAQQTTGVILTTGDSEQHVTVIPLRDMVESDFDRENKEQRDVFAGEARIITEVSFLVEDKVKPVIYFTQGNGELDIEGMGRGRGGSGASELRQYLTQRNFEIKPLRMELDKLPKFDDATAVVILGPTRPLPEELVKAITAYVAPQDLGKKTGGKVLMFLPPFPEPNLKDIAKTGLEGLLGQLDVRLGDDVLVSFPTNLSGHRGGPHVVLEPSDAVAESGSALVRALRSIYLSANVREVRGGEAAPGRGGPLTWATFLETRGGVPVWHETNWDAVSNWTKVAEQIVRRNRNVITEKRATDRPMPVAILGAEGGPPLLEDAKRRGKPRFAIFGTVEMVDDEALRQPGAAPTASLELIAGTLDWLRERPSNIGIKPREIKLFQIDKDYSFAKAFTLPVVLVCLGIVALGAGVWVVRRR